LPQRRRWAIGLGCGVLAAGAGSLDGAVLISSDIAGTPVPVPAGPRALALGGAFTAIADDATAATANPGGMPQLERVELSLSGGWYWQQVRPEDGNRENASAVAFDHASVVVPFFAAGAQHAFGLFWKRLFDFTLDLDVPFSDGVALDADSRTEQRGEWSAWGMSYAVEPLPTLGLGVSLLVWNDALTGASSYTQLTTTRALFDLGGIESVSEVIEEREFTIEEGYSVVIGLWWQPVPRWSFGLTVKPEYRLDLAARTFETLIEDGVILGDPRTPSQQSSEFTYPTSVTVGVAHHWNDLNAIAVDVTWTNWSGYHQTADGNASSLVNPLIDSHDFADGWTVRAGFEHVFILDRVVLVGRVGASWERLPASEPVADIAQPETTSATTDDYFGVSAGFSIFRRNVLFDFATELRYGHQVGTARLTGVTDTVDVLAMVARFGLTLQR